LSDDRPRKPFDPDAAAAGVTIAAAIAAVEAALVDAAHGRRGPMVPYASGAGLIDLAAAACAAIASRFLAVGTPRTLGLIGLAGPRTLADACTAAHGAYFAPRELRTADPRDKAAVRAACAADIVCVCDRDVVVDPTWLRAGTHVNLIEGSLDVAALPRAVVADLDALAAMVAGLRDGRQLDELTIFAPRDLGLAEHAVARAAASHR
jgi:hypothetical protein